MAAVISSLVIGGKSHGGKGGGSSGWMGATWGQSVTKKHCWRAALMCVGSWERVICDVRRGGICLIEQPFLQVVAFQRFSEVVW